MTFSLSLWERVGVRAFRIRRGAQTQNALTLTLSQRERGQRQRYGSDRQTVQSKKNSERALAPGAAPRGDPAHQAARPAVQADRRHLHAQAEDLPAGRAAEIARAAQGAGPGLRAEDPGTAHGRA